MLKGFTAAAAVAAAAVAAAAAAVAAAAAAVAASICPLLGQRDYGFQHYLHTNQCLFQPGRPRARQRGYLQVLHRGDIDMQRAPGCENGKPCLLHELP